MAGLAASSIGASVPMLSEGNDKLKVGKKDCFYYAGTFYYPDSGGTKYVVVQAPVGALVAYLPEGTERKTIDSTLYYVYAGIYFQARSVNGEVQYEVIKPPAGGTAKGKCGCDGSEPSTRTPLEQAVCYLRIRSVCWRTPSSVCSWRPRRSVQNR